jgi:hypothetical protein
MQGVGVWANARRLLQVPNSGKSFLMNTVSNGMACTYLYCVFLHAVR